MLDKWPITIPQLTGDEERFAYVYVPDGYEEGTQFPVLYMFDGHNLWDDDEASFGKSWGMLDYLEEIYGTDIDNPDTDGDGLLDGDEINIGTSPNNPDTNGKEYFYLITMSLIN